MNKVLQLSPIVLLYLIFGCVLTLLAAQFITTSNDKVQPLSSTSSLGSTCHIADGCDNYAENNVSSVVITQGGFPLRVYMTGDHSFVDVLSEHYTADIYGWNIVLDTVFWAAVLAAGYFVLIRSIDWLVPVPRRIHHHVRSRINRRRE